MKLNYRQSHGIFKVKRVKGLGVGRMKGTKDPQKLTPLMKGIKDPQKLIPIYFPPDSYNVSELPFSSHHQLSGNVLIFIM